eukprot:GILK01000367.1.p1 GENE.GILK01000367.1~~GILK01000367.1.p1  ORF type:complete len:478 (-),score=85.42 GILK01000367.1:276-1652(-)
MDTHASPAKRKAEDEVAEKKEHKVPKIKPYPNDKIVLATHPNRGGVTNPVPIEWGAADPLERGPVVATIKHMGVRNAIGTHSGSYGIYRALAVACGALDPTKTPDFTNTAPAIKMGPFPAWSDPEKLVSIDPFGHVVADVYKEYLDEGYDIRPTIAVTKAHIHIPELKERMEKGLLVPDGKILLASGDVVVTKAAIDMVWYLPGVAKRFGCDENTLRQTLFQQTAGMYTELITRPDLKVFLPPVGGMTAYMFGDVSHISDPNYELAVRVHDECNGSDVFGSDICTCRPYLAHGIEVAIQTAQRGGAGLIVYMRKEGRALGEVTKYLVYNARKRQEGGDQAATYFKCTENVAGVKDSRFQALMPDVLHWLGITKIDKLVSMSDMKYDAIVGSGITVGERIPIPEDMIPPDARVEIDAKLVAGYFHKDEIDEAKLLTTVGRTYEMVKVDEAVPEELLPKQ